MSADGVFGRINNKAKLHNIELPTDYFNVVLEAGSIPDLMQQEEFLDWTDSVRGLFTNRKEDVNGNKLKPIMCYAWIRITKADDGKVFMMLKETTHLYDPWIVVNISKARGKEGVSPDECDRPYCRTENGDYVFNQRQIKLAKAWDLYDLANEFMSEKAKEFYKEPANHLKK